MKLYIFEKLKPITNYTTTNLQLGLTNYSYLHIFNIYVIHLHIF